MGLIPVPGSSGSSLDSNIIGDENERRFGKIIRDKGLMWYQSGKRKGQGRFYTRHDIFGVFDGLIAHPLTPVTFVQITSLQHLPDRRKKITQFIRIWMDPENQPIMLAGWKGGRKVLDKRFTTEKRYIDAQYYRIEYMTPEGWQIWGKLRKDGTAERDDAFTSTLPIYDALSLPSVNADSVPCIDDGGR